MNSVDTYLKTVQPTIQKSINAMNESAMRFMVLSDEASKLFQNVFDNAMKNKAEGVIKEMEQLCNRVRKENEYLASTKVGLEILRSSVSEKEKKALEDPIAFCSQSMDTKGFEMQIKMYQTRLADKMKNINAEPQGVLQPGLPQALTPVNPNIQQPINQVKNPGEQSGWRYYATKAVDWMLPRWMAIPVNGTINYFADFITSIMNRMKSS